MGELMSAVGEKLPQAIAFFAPEVHNKVMSKQFDNAVSALNAIEDKLAAVGLKVDYLQYFEKELKIPLALIDGLSKEEEPEPRELLQNLFMRHLSGNYTDDSRYAAFVSIIRQLTPLDVRILKIMHDKGTFPNVVSKYEASATAKMLGVEWPDIEISLDNLRGQYLVKTPRSAEDLPLTGDAPLSFSPLGKAFTSACLDDPLPHRST